jgi:hypothetical protein
MWSDGVPDDMLVVLSGQDVLCASHQVKDWLQRTTSAQVRGHWGGAWERGGAECTQQREGTKPTGCCKEPYNSLDVFASPVEYSTTGLL